MKIIHLSDLHLGKRVYDYSMDDDQEYILKEILKVIKDEKADAVVIAGDIYDRSIPSEKAVSLFDEFLTNLMKEKVPTLVISGNHDSAERISFGNKIMEASNIFMSERYEGNVKKVTLEDKYGPVNFYLLPFIKPSDVRFVYPNEEIKNDTDAMSVVIKNMNINKNERNVLISHQFVTGASLGGSEESIVVGTLDNVDAKVFKDFDYVALGHIHGRQNVGGDERICYCGTPLKYSFDECNQQKGVKVVNLLEKKDGKTTSEHKYVELVPLHEMRKLKGEFKQLMDPENYKKTNREDYFMITLLDEDDVVNGQAQLQSVYKNLMKLDYDNTRTRTENSIEDYKAAIGMNPIDLVDKFYEYRNGSAMSDEKKEYMKGIIESIWNGGDEIETN